MQKKLFGMEDIFPYSACFLPFLLDIYWTAFGIFVTDQYHSTIPVLTEHDLKYKEETDHDH